MKVWEGKQVVGFLLTWRLLQPQLQQQMTDKYIISSCYIGAQSDLTQVMTLKKKNLKLNLWAKTDKDRTVLDVNCEQWQTVLRNSVCN